MNISAVTKSGSSEVHGSLLLVRPRLTVWPPTIARTRIVGIDKPKSGFFYPGGNVGGPVPLPSRPTTTPATSCSSGSASEVATPECRLGQPPEHDDERARPARAT